MSIDKLPTTPAGLRRLNQRLAAARQRYLDICADNEDAAGAGDTSVWHDNFAYEENQRQMHALARRLRDMQAHDLGLKAVAIYRDGSKHSQVLSTSSKKKEEGQQQDASSSSSNNNNNSSSSGGSSFSGGGGSSGGGGGGGGGGGW